MRTERTLLGVLSVERSTGGDVRSPVYPHITLSSMHMLSLDRWGASTPPTGGADHQPRRLLRTSDDQQVISKRAYPFSRVYSREIDTPLTSTS